MTAADRYRRVLLGAAALVFVGTLAELWLIGHDETWVQWVPYALAVLGLGAVAAVRFAPTPRRIRAVRGALGAVMAGAVYGVVEHFRQNLAFEMEIRPGVAAMDLLTEAAQGGSPLLASGILLLGGALAFAATLWRE